MWKSYSDIVWYYPKISLSEERRLILEAQKGSKKNKDEIVLRHIGFLIFRIYKKVFPHLIERFGEDLLEEAILVVYKKIESYELSYRDMQGNPHPVKFVSYIWKRIDGFIIDYLRKEMKEYNVPYDDNMVGLRRHYERSWKTRKNVSWERWMYFEPLSGWKPYPTPTYCYHKSRRFSNQLYRPDISGKVSKPFVYQRFLTVTYLPPHRAVAISLV